MLLETILSDALHFDYTTIPVLSTPKKTQSTQPIHVTSLSVLGAHVIRKGLGLLVAVAVAVVVVVAVVMRVSLRANILHLQDVTAFWAALDGAIAGHLRHVDIRMGGCANFAAHSRGENVP